ncbi:dihydrodipicolinate synthase family protein [Actinomadura alba]|uniref:Dihydrodipicolinate synthase family protein n=1 Tax=Actinomadura alba TaxID=406431 RepID=A0ABR7LMZ2_9ACTN|nr:dihydrodipicolinate synthase family protein [Actinomadura alba]MBC6465852.1 dihydrodipicolinate synthase family protein [Actinomadura alba]
MATTVDGRSLLRGVMVPLVTPMTRPGVPSADHAAGLLRALAGAGVHSLMLFGSNGEGPLLPASSLTGFATGVAEQWRELTGGRPVLATITGAGTGEALHRAEAVLPAEPDAVVLSPPIYYRHRDDEIVAHYAALAEVGVPVVAYNVPRYSNPLSPPLIDEIAAMPHVVGMKDSSNDLALLGHVIEAARRRPDFGVSQGAERQLLAGLRLGADGVVPGMANLAPRLPVELVDAHQAGRDADAERAQKVIDQMLALHDVRPGVPAVKAVLDERGLCPPHVAAPFVPCTPSERRALSALLGPYEAQLLHA